MRGGDLFFWSHAPVAPDRRRFESCLPLVVCPSLLSTAAPGTLRRMSILSLLLERGPNAAFEALDLFRSSLLSKPSLLAQRDRLLAEDTADGKAKRAPATGAPLSPSSRQQNAEAAAASQGVASADASRISFP